MHVNLRAGVRFVRDSLCWVDLDDSSSRYADPEAEGVRPVLTTANVSFCDASYSIGAVLEPRIHSYLQIFLISLGCLVRFAVVAVLLSRANA